MLTTLAAGRHEVNRIRRSRVAVRCKDQRPLVRRQFRRKWDKTHCERHCERKDAPKQRELCDESQPLGVSLRR